MVKTNYNYQGTWDSARMARAFTTNQPASVKWSNELSRTLKGKKLEAAELFLNRVMAQEEYMPVRTYTKKVPHRRGNATLGTKAGRYPVRTCQIWLNLLNSVRANADVKGLDTKKLQIVHCHAAMGFSRSRNQAQGRINGKRRKSKSTHIEIIVKEVGA